MSEKNVIETYLEHSSTHEVLLHDKDDNAKPLVIITGNGKIQSLEEYRDKPLQISTDREFCDLRGFVDYVNDFKTDTTACFTGAKEIRTIFDYHGKDNPRWGKHQAVFAIQISRRWKIWEQAHNQWMSQKQFADFLDSGLNEIIDPSQAVILTLVQNFRATTSYEYDSENSAGREELRYRKIVQGGSSKSETITLPDYVTLALQPFENIEVLNDRLPEELQIPAYELKAKINWQVNTDGAGLMFKVQILNVENVVNKTLEIIKNAVNHLTEVKTYIG